MDRTPSQPAESNPRAVVLLSGGLDSATTLAIARSEGFECHALSFDYGQRHRFELDAARRIARQLGVARHVVMVIDLRSFGGSALTDPGAEVPRDGVPPGIIPVTYVPARNLVFLSLAVAFAEPLGARDVFIGVNALDYSGYPDCRPEFVEQFERVANLGTKAGVTGSPLRIHAPLVHWTKSQIIHRGTELGVDYGLTFSCYDPDAHGRACGRCDSCRLRARGFLEAGVEDSTEYVGGVAP